MKKLLFSPVMGNCLLRPVHTRAVSTTKKFVVDAAPMNGYGIHGYGIRYYATHSLCHPLCSSYVNRSFKEKLTDCCRMIKITTMALLFLYLPLSRDL